MKLSRRRLLALGAAGALVSACQPAPKVIVSERPVQGQIEPGRVPPTPLPTPRPIAAVDDRTLQRELDAFLREQQGAFGVAIADLHGPVTAGFDAEDRFQLGSLYKLVLMAEVMRQLRSGRIARGATVQTLADYSFIEPQGGIPPGTRIPVEQALAAMIAVSSNAAALALTELATPAELIAAPRRLGLGNTSIDVAMVNGPGHYSIDARGSARDFVGLLVKIDREELVGPEQDRRMVDLMLGQKIVDRIPLLLPPDVPIAHKTADLDSYTHDAGLVYLPGRPYAIAILAQGLNLADGKAIVAEISRIAFAYFSARR
ncbi:MAG TPA: serine hydrolase [Chloroflexota bacterium]